MKRNSIAGHSNTLLTISSIYSSMTKAEKKVADTVLSDPEAAVHYTITDLSEKAEVGETSVIRFCRKLGFRGYHEFKLSITVAVLNATSQDQSETKESNDPQSIVNQVTATNAKVITDTKDLLQLDALLAAAKIMLSKKKVHFFGVGSSGITALDAYYRFMRIGIESTVERDAHFIAMSAALLTEDDVVFGVSTSGSTKDLVDPIKIAKNNGATVICLTSHAKSPITQHADTILLVPAKESPLQGGSLTTKIAQIQALDILSNIMIAMSKEHTTDSIMKTANAVADKLY